MPGWAQPRFGGWKKFTELGLRSGSLRKRSPAVSQPSESASACSRLEVAHVLRRQFGQDVAAQAAQLDFDEEAERGLVAGSAVAAVPALPRGHGVVVEGVPVLAGDEGAAFPPALALVGLADVPSPETFSPLVAVVRGVDERLLLVALSAKAIWMLEAA